VLDRKPTLLSMEDLGMAPRILEQYEQFALDLPTGVVLVTGPTGSGKTTTLYASIDRVNSPEIKIISAEDPVEFAIPGIVQCPINPKAGVDFASTLRSMVRQDPDIIVVGEIRDVETAEMAIQAALTGHKVFSTFHSEDTVGSLVRLVNMDIETFLIASTVVAVVAQRLVRRLCPHCREPSRPGPRILGSLGVDPDYFEDFPIYFGRGCMHCMDTGFRGRVGIYECLFLDQRVRDAILERAPSHAIRAIATESTNLVSMLEDGLVKAALGHTTPEEVMRHAPRSGRPRSLTTLMELGGWPAGGKA
jgi:type IV pilus assembly protein PilB